MMMSIQMWAPMYAVLNMVLNVMAKSKSMAAVSVIGASGGVTKVILYGTIPKLVEANEWVSAVAGYGMSLIPFLAYGLFRYGAGALTQISSHFGGVAQSALSGAADMKTTGSMGIGNRSFDTESRSNTTALKHDTNMSVSAGKTSVQEFDGSGFSVAADGSSIYNLEAGMSQLGMNIDIGQDINSSIIDRISDGMSKSVGVSKNFASTVAAGVGIGLPFDIIKANLSSQGEWKNGDSEQLSKAINYAKEHNIQKLVSSSINQKLNQEFVEHLESSLGKDETKKILNDSNKARIYAKAFSEQKANALMSSTNLKIKQTENTLSAGYGDAKIKIDKHKNAKK